MIDTINFYLDAEPDEEADQSAYDEVFIKNSSKGTSSRGKTYILNDRINTNLSVMRNTTGSRVSNNRFVNVSSLSYVMGADCNVETVGPRSLKRAFVNLHTLLKDNGMKIDLYNAKLSRLDLTITIKVSNPIPLYFPLLRALHPAGYEKHEHDGRNLTFKGNEAHSIIIYDKLFELEKKHSLQPAQIRAEYGMSKDEHLMRFEFQYRKAAQIERHLKITRVSELIDQRHRLAEFIKDQVRGLFGEVDIRAKDRGNLSFNENQLLIEQFQRNESHYYYYSILRNCNYNIEEALQIACLAKKINNQRFRHRTKGKLQEVLQKYKQVQVSSNKNHYLEIIRAIYKPIWM